MPQDHLNMSLSWNEINLHSKSLARKLMDLGPWKGVIAVTRGGLVPACVIARQLGLHHIETFCISTYNDQTQGTTSFIKKPDGVDDGSGWLVIDDLSDTGNTFRTIRTHLPNAHYAAIYAKPKGEDAIDTYIMSVSEDTWIHFPWEEDEVSYIPPKTA